MLFSTGMSFATKPTTIKEILSDYVVQKVEYSQSLIHFTDNQAKQLNDLELNYLLEVNRLENCKCHPSSKQLIKLNEKRDTNLRKVLNQLEYNQYKAIEQKEIKKHPVWSK
jgi:hypothetical protein